MRTRPGSSSGGSVSGGHTTPVTPPAERGAHLDLERALRAGLSKAGTQVDHAGHDDRPRASMRVLGVEALRRLRPCAAMRPLAT